MEERQIERVREKEKGESKLLLVPCGVVVPHQPAMLTLLLLSILCVCMLHWWIVYVNYISRFCLLLTENLGEDKGIF